MVKESSKHSIIGCSEMQKSLHLSDFERMFMQQVTDLQKNYSDLVASVAVAVNTQQHILECVRELKDQNKNNDSILTQKHNTLVKRVDALERKQTAHIWVSGIQAASIVLLLWSNGTDIGKFFFKLATNLSGASI